MLRALSEAGVKIAVVSSNSEAVIRRVLGEELGNLISLYACGASLFGKARKFKQVTRQGVSRDKIICIGDETRDIEAARKVGLDCGAVGWGYAKPSILAQHGPTVSFSSMSEIISYVGASKAAVGGD